MRKLPFVPVRNSSGVPVVLCLEHIYFAVFQVRMRGEQLVYSLVRQSKKRRSFPERVSLVGEGTGRDRRPLLPQFLGGVKPCARALGLAEKLADVVRQDVLKIAVEGVFIGVKNRRHEVTGHWLDPGQCASLGEGIEWRGISAVAGGDDTGKPPVVFLPGLYFVCRLHLSIHPFPRCGSKFASISLVTAGARSPGCCGMVVQASMIPPWSYSPTILCDPLPRLPHLPGTSMIVQPLPAPRAAVRSSFSASAAVLMPRTMRRV